MKLAEVIRGLGHIAGNFCEPWRDLALQLDKTPIEVKRRARGLFRTAFLMPLLNEAMYAVMEGRGPPAEAVDEVFKLGMAHPMGPLTLGGFHRARCLP